MAYRSHISRALAAATVQCPDVIASIVRADCAQPGNRTLGHLHEARESLIDLMRELNMAIAEEMADMPMRSGVELVS